ncbi:EF-hand domain-containing protein [Sphingomonas sp.]|uniref:EF-hand domain-containing protein n=1 Tax=Sphingomonas sp. TaxID=28214 RepID=UPI0025DD1767|nr:EF-hand domain-containing protein [Sphingomonas sp.]MBV9527950.1 EF-hand domain-containing protein [Sphingomonas sp.]
MVRFFAGAAATLLFLTGAFLLWQSRAAEPTSTLPAAPAGRPASAVRLLAASVPSDPPEATTASREEKRFSRADRNKDGKIESDEIFAARHKAFAKLDANGNGSLSFEEWAAKTITKFQGADANHDGWLSDAEYATTAPPPPKHKRCSC